ncbi:glycosyltransferase family 2 protein [Mesorhizobium sp. ANAO-SY3R2]|uniref:glycosyltransferase family 2 protein n=1 Tax=Mesorhizobium sp. ANAO-SY3R2 TaxID=3166644 RepID=UPI00366AF15E
MDLVVVTHNSGAVLQSFLKSVPNHVRTIVVDNGSSDDTVEVATAAGARVIRVGDNVGYGSACNIGAAAGTASLVLFVNPDVRFEEGAIKAFVSAAAAHPNAAFNPRIYTGSRRRFRRRSRLLPASEHWQGAAPDDDCVIPVLHGACIVLRREHFNKVGGFDAKIFLFHEDDDLSIRLRQAGVELRLAAKALIDHDEGNSSARSSQSSRIKGEAMGRSLVYVMQKHGLHLNVPAERRRTWLRFLSPHVLLRNARRSKLLGFLHGLGLGPADQFGSRS